MILLGLAGHAASGKDTVADYLVSHYGFVKFSFGDGVRRQLAAAYGIKDDSCLTDRRYKETPVEALALENCTDPRFVQVARAKISHENPDTFFDLDTFPLSPRWLQQTWGSEYRRASDPDYWIKRADDWMYDVCQSVPYPELRPNFVNTSVRFENEREWIESFDCGNVWHLHRDTAAPVHAHESETPLLVLPGERQIWNNGSIDHLCQAVDLLLSTNAPTVRCEPMEQVVGPNVPVFQNEWGN